MAYNVPTYQKKRFSFGPGILYMGPQGATPTVEIGAVKGDASFEITRERLEIFQGSPQTKIAQYAIKEEGILKVTGIEWNFDNFAYALGAGMTSITEPEEVLEFGGDMDMSNRALRYVHRAPDGSTIDLHVFKAEGAGMLAIAFKETDTHEFPYEFHSLEGTSDFEDAALVDKKKLFKIIRTKAA